MFNVRERNAFYEPMSSIGICLTERCYTREHVFDDAVTCAVGQGVPQWGSGRPVIAGLTEPTRAKVLNADTARALASGEYDQLFVDAPDRPSDLYRASQAHYLYLKFCSATASRFNRKNSFRLDIPHLPDLHE